MSLRRVDLAAILGFLADVGRLEFDDPYPIEFVARLRDLVPCDALTYQEIDLRARRFPVMVGIDPDGPAGEADGDALYWAVGPCPISDYRARTGSLAAIRMSDVIRRRRYLELPIFREYFHPVGLDHAIDIGLPAPAERLRSFILFRQTCAGDFSDRDRGVLEMLRPHLHDLEERAALRRRLKEVPAALESDSKSRAWDTLTSREREILALVADGRTNVQIAALLWVAPSTVKKHLEHIYEKLGVGGRTAAAMHMRNRLPVGVTRRDVVSIRTPGIAPQPSAPG